MRTALSMAVLALAGSAIAQMPLPPFSNTFTSTLTRGFWFQSPVNCVIVGLSVPNEAAQSHQVVEVIDFGAVPPPTWPATANGIQLFYNNSTAAASLIPCAIPVAAGQHIGILGACTAGIGGATSYNSYGPNGPFLSDVLGIPTTITRFGTQFGIGSTGGNHPCWTEPPFNVSRVEVYLAPSGNGTFATNTSLGAGCINIPEVSSYEEFATSAAFDLSNSSLTLLHIGSGYLALPGVTSYVPPSATAQVLALFDDSEVTVNLSQPMPVGASSTTTTLTVCSNGFISPATGNGTSYSPFASGFLNSPQAWWSLNWHDYNPSIAGSGQVKFEQIGTIAYVTWDGVWDYGGTSVADANTMQAQFDLTTGTVHYVYGTMSPNGNNRLVGFSGAGPSADPGSMDISAALPATYTAAVFAVTPLALTASSRPVTNTSWNLTTGNIPSSGVIGVDVFGVSDPGINDLFFIGMPGCGLRASLDVLLGWPVAGATHTYSLPIPNNPSLVNVHLYTTSAVFQVPPVNAFGAITSNGIDGKIGDL